jgi:hypothetical protein
MGLSLEDHVHAGVGVVHQNVQPPRLLGRDLSEQLMDVCTEEK